MAKIRSLTLLKESPKAFYVSQTDRRNNEVKAWIPKSQVDYLRRHPKDHNGDELIDINVPDWLAEDKNLSYD